MSLKILITKAEFEALSDALKEHYKDGGDGESYMLDSDDASFSSKIGEFRTNNITLMQEKKALIEAAKKFEGVDLEKYDKAVKQMLDLEDKELIEAGDIDKLVNKRTERMRADFEGKSTAQSEALDTAQKGQKAAEAHLAKVVIDADVQLEVTKVGTVRKGAMTDILSRARNVYQLQEGKPVPMKDGDVLYGTDGKNPLTITEWATGLLKDAPYLFEGSAGGGAGGSGDDQDRSTQHGVIDAHDKVAIGDNLEDIASGKVKVALLPVK